MTDHYQAMIDALKKATKESRKAIEKAKRAERLCFIARTLMTDPKKDHSKLRKEIDNV